MLGLRVVLLVSRAIAKLLMMHAKEPTVPKPSAISSLASISQRPEPCHQWNMSSVGQMSALMKIKRLDSRMQNTRLDAARLRFLICQMKGGVSMMRVKRASVGSATAAGGIEYANPDIVRGL